MRPIKFLNPCFFIGFYLLTAGFSFSQNDSISGIKQIDYFLVSKKYTEAENLLNLQIKQFKAKQLYDSLYRYPYYIGKIFQKKTSTKTAITKAENFVEYIIHNTKNLDTHYKTLLNLVKFYDEIGENNKSIQKTKRALNLVKKSKNASLYDVGKVQYNLGASYLEINNIKKASYYLKKAITNYEKEPNTSLKKISDGYNAMGAVMWMSTKLDSSKLFYQKAIESVKKSKGDSIENLYLTTIIQSNISLLEYSQGNLSKALDIQKEVINNYQAVIGQSKDEATKNKALRYQARALNNLAVFYNDIGNLKKSLEILEYSYKKKKLFLEPEDLEIITTQINIGQAQLSLHEYIKAIETLNKALKKLKSKEKYWRATALFAQAEAYSQLGNIKRAKALYRESELLFENALNGNFDKEFLNFLQSKALFLSSNNEPEKAINTALKAYNYVFKNTSNQTDFPLIKLMATIAKVHYNNKEYKKAKQWTAKGNQYLSNHISRASTKIDSIRLEFERPTFLLLDAMSNTQNDAVKDSVFIKKQLQKLQKAIAILEYRKTATLNIEDVNHLFSEYKEIYDFTKKLYLNLFELTQNQDYLNKTIAIHESAIYNRIRTRLNIQNTILFNDIPSEVLQTEKELKQKMNNSLSSSDNSVLVIQDFFKVNEQWNTFLVFLKNNYPKYYKMRYATIEEPLGDIQKAISENTTIVRYVFIDRKLHAFVINKNRKTVTSLPYRSKNNLINKLRTNQSHLKQTSNILHKLYQELWQPIESEISTKKVIIIPDAELFNLSFETLTKTKIKCFDELATNSLLSNYYITYNYSLFLLKQKSKTLNYKENFIAFVPEFTDKMKKKYRQTVTDTLQYDLSYINLLPQPFSLELAKKYGKKFGGKIFTNEKATKQLFKKYAKNHKIIHIGTHAESNNLTPGLSRLIFAKDIFENSNNNDNSLYTFEIYEYNLSSNLTVLTACETGKPTYQAGEGMISLAHAFNYAGSESILTGLWRIDEQTSTEIIRYFYDNLSLRMDKDEALQKAKIKYLKNTNGRTNQPQFWAGLVLMGSDAPINFTHESNILLFIIFALILIAVLFVLFLKNKRNK